MSSSSDTTHAKTTRGEMVLSKAGTRQSHTTRGRCPGPSWSFLGQEEKEYVSENAEILKKVLGFVLGFILTAEQVVSSA